MYDVIIIGATPAGIALAEKLSEKLDIPYISAGFIFREMAAEKGMSVLEFSEFAEGNDDIDKEIDKRQAELAKSADNLIVEGRLSAYFASRIWIRPARLLQCAPLQPPSEWFSYVR